MKSWLLLLPALLVACSDDTPAVDDAGTPVDTGTSADGTPSDNGTDAPSEVGPPPASTCGAPVKLVDTSAPTTVIGDGAAASCTEPALVAALAKGGIVTFKCGAAPVTITVTKTLTALTTKNTTLDGGGLVTLDGGGKVRILEAIHPDYRKNDAVLTLQRIAFKNGRATGTKAFKSAPAPCSQGYYDGEGGAVRVRDMKVHVVDAVFADNKAAELGPDVGGGALYVMGCKEVVVTGSTFTGNTGSNGGAIGSLNSQLDVYDSTFTSNRAVGNGANSDDASKCSVIADTGQHQVGSGGNGGAVVIDGGSDLTHTFCGVKFRSNGGGAQAFGGAIFRTPNGAKQKTVIDRSLFEANTGDGGGALYFHNSNLTITASTFVKNIGQGPGVLQSDGTTIDFTNVTFAGNSSKKALAAGFALFGGDGKITNSTFVDNVCEADNMFGCAIFGSPNLTIQNSIFSGNNGKNPTEPMQCKVGSATTGSGDLQWPKKKLVGSADDQPCVPGITFVDPKLGALADNGGPVPTMLPPAGSPAIGIGTGCPATDARGKPRSASKCAAGAVEP